MKKIVIISLLVLAGLFMTSCMPEKTPADGETTASYQDGRVSYTAVVEKPTPCHELSVDEQVVGSDPVQIRVTVQIEQPPEGDICAQVITEETISGEIEVDQKPAQLSILVEGEEIYSTSFDD